MARDLQPIRRSVFDPPLKRSGRRPTGEPAYIRDFICYHDPDVMGRDFRDGDAFHVLTKKVVRDLDGDVVWLIVKSWSGTAYYLASRFRVARVWNQAAGLNLLLSDDLQRAVIDGFGANPNGEDPFDAVVGLLAILKEIARPAPGRTPAVPEVQHLEGWIFGQSHLPLGGV